MDLGIGVGAPLLPDNRQLQHPRALAFRQYIHENRAAVRKRESVVMLFRSARLNLAKSRNAKADLVGRVQTTKVSKTGEPLELTLWIKKMTRLDGRDMAMLNVTATTSTIDEMISTSIATTS